MKTLSCTYGLRTAILQLQTAYEGYEQLFHICTGINVWILFALDLKTISRLYVLNYKQLTIWKRLKQ